MSPTVKGQLTASIFDGLDELGGNRAHLTPNRFPTSVTRRNYYDNIYCLLACWDQDEAFRREETIRLGNAFNQHYLVKCDQFTIVEGPGAQASLESTLRQLTHKARIGHNLLILFYTGSSDYADGQFVLRSSARPKSSCVIEWNSALQILTEPQWDQPSDVLVILDCVYSMHGQSQPATAYVEILAASDDTTNVGINSNSSLTMALENALHVYEGKTVSVAELAEYIKTSNLSAQPIHKMLTPTRSTGIRIALPAGRGAHSSERRGVLKLKLKSGEELPDLAQSKDAINDWLQSTLARDATVSNEPRIRAHNAEIAFRGRESIATDEAYWQRVVQKRPEMVSHAELELSSPFGPDVRLPCSSTEKVNNLVDTLQVNDAILKVLPNKYAKVCVVPLMWENIERGLEQEEDLNMIRDVFRDEYNYDVDEIYRIKSDIHALTSLKAHIGQKLNDLKGTDELLITVYGGHGKNPKTTMTNVPRMILTDTAAGKFNLDWSSVRSDLYQAHCDTLTIMNCCYGGNAALEEVHGTNEILSAVNRDTKAYTLDRSFLKFLSTELKTAAQMGGTNISWLYQALDRHNEAGEDAIEAPWRHRNPIDKPSIRLRPLLPGQAPRVDNIDTADESFYVQFFLRNVEEIEISHYNEFFNNWDAPPTVKAIRFHKKDSLQKVSEVHQTSTN